MRPGRTIGVVIQPRRCTRPSNNSARVCRKILEQFKGVYKDLFEILPRMPLVLFITSSSISLPRCSQASLHRWLLR